MPYLPPNPQVNEAYAPSSHQYYELDSLDIGLRVQIQDYVIPEPASLSLLGLGLMGMFGIGFRKQKRDEK